MSKKIYLFDFDGTISKRDSFILFSFFSIPLLSFVKYWFLVFILLPFKSRSSLKESFFDYFKGQNLSSFNNLCEDFISKKLEVTIKQSFLSFISEIDKNSKIVVVSASISNYLKPWCNKMGFDIISTELESIEGELTGKFLEPNCNGIQKAIKINDKYDLSKYNEIHVFGNSKGDLPMLELGTHKYYRFFN